MLKHLREAGRAHSSCARISAGPKGKRDAAQSLAPGRGRARQTARRAGKIRR